MLKQDKYRIWKIITYFWSGDVSAFNVYPSCSGVTRPNVIPKFPYLEKDRAVPQPHLVIYSAASYLHVIMMKITLLACMGNSTKPCGFFPGGPIILSVLTQEETGVQDENLWCSVGSK